MRRNGYLCTSGVNLDTAVQFADPDFQLECIISAIWQRFTLTPMSIIPTKFEVDNDTLPSYSIFVCWYVTWLCDLDFWPFDSEQLLCMAGHVTNLATKFEDPKPISSWFMSHNVSRWLPLRTRTRPLRTRRTTWPVSTGSETITFLESPTLICLFTMHLQWLYDESN